MRFSLSRLSQMEKYCLPSFRGKKIASIIQEIKEIPLPHREIDFSKTGIFELNTALSRFRLSPAEIIEIFYAIPSHITHLNLSYCNISSTNRLTQHQAEELYAAIGQFDKITFKNDLLGSMPNLEQLLRNLEPKELVLRECFLAQAPISRLKKSLAAISETVTHLDLADNGLSQDIHKARVSLAAVALKCLEQINVSGNGLDNPKYISPKETRTLFSVFPTKCLVTGIDFDMIEKRFSTGRTSNAERKQAIEDKGYLLIKKNLGKDATLIDCVSALTDLFQFTRTGMNWGASLFAGNDFYMQIKCSLAVTDFIEIEDQLESFLNAVKDKSVTPLEIEEFLSHFSYVKTNGCLDKMLLTLTEKLQEIIEALPAARKPAAEIIKIKIVTNSRELLQKVLETYETCSQKTSYNPAPHN